ncbi:MAG: outer membrane protein assembly factor BamA [Candidatus Omnitrophota bacterium]
MKKQIINCTILILLVFNNFSFAQEETRIVREIKVIDNKVVSEPVIISKLQTKTNREYSSVVLSEDIKRLYATGLFEDVRADVEEIENGLKIVFQVKEKPVLEEIKFQGNKRIKARKLQKEMAIKKKQIFDQFKLKTELEKLKKFYAKKGYSLAELEYTTEEKDSQVIVTVTVHEGPRVRISNIVFEGNNSFSGKRLQKLIKTKKKWWLNSGFIKDDVLEEDIERLIFFYQLEGFIDVAVESLVTYNQNKTKMFITFNIREGKQYKVGNVQIIGNQIFKEDQLKEKLNLSKDVIYNEEKLRNDISKIQSCYFDEGYIASRVNANTVLNSETGRVDLSYEIKEGQIAYVDKVNIKGNVRTKDVVVRREIRLYPGDRYNGEKLRRSRERLYNLDYFDEVTFDTAEEPSTLPDKYDMDIFVKERKTGEFSFGAGYSSVDKFIGFVDLTQKNFDLLNFPTFAGAGQKLRMRMEFGSDKKDYELGFIEPWFWGYPVSVGFNIYSRNRGWDKYDEKRIGGNVFVGKEFGEYWGGKLTHRYESVRISEVAADASQDIKIEEGKNYISSLTASISHDSRDNIYNPTKGSYNDFSCEYGGGFLGADKDFVKYQTTDSIYFQIGQKSVLELKTRGGLVEAFDYSQDVPVYERFYAGGANTIRGYKERRVGPEGEYGDPIGGRILAVFNAEWTYKLAKNLKWAFFYDLGNVWPNLNEFHWDNLKLKASIGTGFRVKTPLGPIRLDYGYALNPKEGDSRGRFHFSMSHEF